MVLIAAFQLEDHYREKAVNVVLNSNLFFGYSVFLILTRPSTNNKMFPYTVKTSQVIVTYNYLFFVYFEIYSKLFPVNCVFV